MGSASLFGWGGPRQIEANGENEHPSFPDLFCNFFVASGETCNRSHDCDKELQAFHQGHGLVAKNISVCKK